MLYLWWNNYCANVNNKYTILPLIMLICVDPFIVVDENCSLPIIFPKEILYQSFPKKARGPLTFSGGTGKSDDLVSTGGTPST